MWRFIVPKALHSLSQRILLLPRASSAPLCVYVNDTLLGEFICDSAELSAALLHFL